MSFEREESRATFVGKWLLAAVVPGSALALGSIPPEVLVVVSALAAVACGLLWSAPGVVTSRASRRVLLAFAILLGMTILQAVPLPAAIGQTIAPASADIWARALTPFREGGPSLHPLSIAPPATRVEALKGFFYVCVFLGALRVAMLEHGERFLVRLVVVATSLMAFSALAHAAVSAERVFGVYRPVDVNAYVRGRLSPLLNTNHLAAYSNVGACVALGALLSRRMIPRALSGSMMLVLAATSMWQASRGATGALLFGVVATFALTFYVKRRFESARAERVILAACAIAATIVVSISLSGAGEKLVSRDLGKIEVARKSMALLASSPWLGFGRGGFETVFSSVREATTYMTWTNPEDIVVQWLVEWGIPVSILGFVLLAWALRPQVLVRAVRPAIGAWVAIVATLVHELVDFHLEVPGVVALVLVCMAIVVSGRPSTSRDSGAGSATRSMRPFAFASVLGTAIFIAVVLPDSKHTLAQDRRHLSAAAVDRSLPREAFRAELRAAMLRYPAEPFFPLMGAVRAQIFGDESVVPWTARALERNPHFGRAHFVLARSLAPRYPAQARLEYRLAYRDDEALRETIARESVHIVEDPRSALELVPEGAAGIEMLDALVVALSRRLPSTAVILDQEIARRAPASLLPVRRRAEAAVMDAVTDAPWCTPRSACLANAEAAANELVRRDPSECGSHLLVARLGVKRGDAGKALDAFERDMVSVTNRPACQRERIALALASNEKRRGDKALEELVKSGCGSTADCLDLYTWAASMEEQRGHFARAVRLYRRVLDLSPEREDILQRIGDMGDRAGLRGEALDAYSTLALRNPSDPRWPARIAELRSGVAPRPSVSE